MRFVFAIVAATVLLLGVAAPHHHGGSGGVHECVACTVGGALEARDATPAMSPPPLVRVVVAMGPVADPVSGFPLGAVPGQSPPLL